MPEPQSSLPDKPERKLPCGCYAELRQGNTQMSWAISAVAFLCDKGHRQGDVLVKP